MHRIAAPNLRTSLVLGAFGLVIAGLVTLRVSPSPETWLALTSFPVCSLAVASWARQPSLMVTALAASLTFAALFWASHPPTAGLPSALILVPVGCAAGLLLMLRHERPRPSVGVSASLTVTAGLVGFFSGAHGSGDGMRSWLANLGWSAATVDTVLFVFRKGVHLTFYLVVAALTIRLAWGVGQRGRALPFALLWTLGLALSDEIRQTTLDSRTGSWADVLLDMVGAAMGAWLALRVSPKKSGRPEGRP